MKPFGTFVDDTLSRKLKSLNVFISSISFWNSTGISKHRFDVR